MDQEPAYNYKKDLGFDPFAAKAKRRWRLRRRSPRSQRWGKKDQRLFEAYARHLLRSSDLFE